MSSHNETLPDTQTVYQARLFGVLHIFQEQSIGCTSVALPTSSAARSLLAYMLLKGNHPTQRLFLAGQFWPGVTEANARRSLRHTIWQIGQSLPGLLKADPSTLCISPDFAIKVDVAEFEALAYPYLAGKGDLQAAVQNLSRAAELYEGDFLAEFYDDWTITERERLREMYFQVLECLISALKATSRDEQALQIALRLASADPLRENAHREVMRLYHYLGRPESALRQFETCRTTLQHELGFEPDAETRALAQTIARRSQLLQAPYLPATHPVAERNFLAEAKTACLPLIGRADERSELLHLIDPLYRGIGGIILLEGEAGVGKTRLLQETGRDAEWRGAQVLWGKAIETESGTIYGPLIDALGNSLSALRIEQLHCLIPPFWLQVLQPIFPALASESPEQSPLPSLEGVHGQNRLAEALTQLLSAWGQIVPLVLIIEDLQWAGEDMLDLLVRLAHQLNQMAVLMIGSYRGEEVRCHPRLWEKLQKLDPITLRGRLTLASLDATATGKLIRTSLGTHKSFPNLEAHLHNETGGNPLFVLETLRALYDEGQLVQDENGEWRICDDDAITDRLSQAVEQIIARRLELLTPGIRRVLNAAAVLGDHFDFMLFAALELSDIQSLLAALGNLVHRHLLVETSQAYAFSHDKVSQVVYESILTDERIELHAHVAQTLEAVYPTRMENLAHHFTRGQVWPKALHYQKQAADKARQAEAYMAVVEHLSAALYAAEQVRLSPPQRFNLLMKREIALDILGDRQAQESDLKAMQQLAGNVPQTLGLVYQRQALLLIQCSRYDEAEAEAQKAMQLARDCDDEPARAAALISLGKSIQQRGETDRAIPYFRQAAEICRQMSDTRQEARACAALAGVIAEAQPDEALAEAQHALALYEQLGDRHGQAQVCGTLGNIYLEQGQTEAARSHLLRALESARAIGYRYEEARSLANLGNVFVGDNGQISIALQYYQQASNIFRMIGNRGAENILRINIASIRFNSLGEDETARIDAEASLAYCIEMGDNYGKSASLGLLGLVALQRRDFPSARSYLQTSLACALEDGNQWQASVSYLYLIDVALDEGDPQAALHYLDAAQHLCQEAGFTNLETSLLGQRGTVMLALDQPQAALEATREAMNRLKPGIDAASLIPYRHFLVLTALGQAEEARIAIDQAHQLLVEELAGLTPEQRQTSIERVPNNRAILAAWEALQPRRASLRLPRVEAPTGRPLHDDEWMNITWTLSTPEDEHIVDKVARRRQRLLRLLQEAAAQGAAPAYKHLAEALQISPRTLAKDMAVLRRTHTDLPLTRLGASRK